MLQSGTKLDVPVLAGPVPQSSELEEIVLAF
jgi:hypothetical protein